MADAATVAESAAHRLLAAYQEAEARMLAELARRTATHSTLPPSQWMAHKASEVHRIRQAAVGAVERLDGHVLPIIREEVAAAWEAGWATMASAPERLGTPDAVLAIAQEAVAGAQRAHLGILRWHHDVYRAVQAEVAEAMATGTLTLPQAIQQSLDRYAQRGITGFTDRAGRQWGLQEYSEMQVRTGTARAHLHGALQGMEEANIRLVIVTYSPEPCEVCEPWEGQVLAQVPGEHGHSTIAQAEAAGLFHPNCTHGLGAYTPGLTTRPEQPARDPEAYGQRQQQRALERRVRAAHRLQAVAVTPGAQRHAATRLTAARQAHNEFIRRTGRLPQQWRTRPVRP